MSIATSLNAARKGIPAARLPGLTLLAALALIGAPVAAHSGVDADAVGTQRSRALENYGKLPLTFIENRGQTDEAIAYYLQASAYSLYFTREGHALRLVQGQGAAAKSHTISVELVDAATKRVESREPASGIVNYLKGSKDNWRTGIPTHAGIGYVQPWAGIDLAYNGRGGKLESVYTVAPHADPAKIKLRYSGQDSLKIDDDGNLVYATSAGEVKETAPIFYQDIDGDRVSVEGRYRLIDEDTVSFQVARYARDHALVIDPTLVYSGFIGGDATDFGAGVAVDTSGNAYVVGRTNSSPPTFPVLVGPDSTYNAGAFDAFIAKVRADGTALTYIGYIGGDGDDTGYAVAVDSAGSAYVAGRTTSAAGTFPETAGSFGVAFSGGASDGFVAKVSADGTALVYAGYLGGAGEDEIFGIAVDSTFNAYVSGRTASPEASFPETAGSLDGTYNGGAFDAFVAKVNATGSALVYAGYIGGAGTDAGFGMAVDSGGNAYLTGRSDSTEASFPEVAGPDLVSNGALDAFVAKVNSAGSALVYAGYIGGSARDEGLGIAVDSGGNAYVNGFTASTQPSFPVLVGPDLVANGFDDAFVAKVSTVGALVYAGFIGGSLPDQGTGIAVDAAGSAYLTGSTASANFPALGGPDLTFSGVTDAFVAKVSPTGAALVYSSFIGGASTGTNEAGGGIAVDSAGSAYVTGFTDATQATFPVLVGPDLVSNGGNDAFVTKISDPLGPAGNTIFSNGFE